MSSCVPETAVFRVRRFGGTVRVGFLIHEVAAPGGRWCISRTLRPDGSKVSWSAQFIRDAESVTEGNH